MIAATVELERENLTARYRQVRARSEELCAPLAVDDYQVQSVLDTSPPKWHLAHISWFFETFVLGPFAPSQRAVPSALCPPVQHARSRRHSAAERGRHNGRNSGSMPTMGAPRVKISVSLPGDLVARLDRIARAEARSRSRVLEGWLRATARERAALELEAATIAYYESLTPEDRQEEEAIAMASSTAAKRLRIDAGPGSGLRRRRS